MKNILFLLLFLTLSKQVLAARLTGFVNTSNGSELYVQYTKAEPGKPTFVFNNGLVYEIERWSKVSQALTKLGYGVLHYEFEGQNRSYLQSMNNNNGHPNWLYKGIKLDDSAQQLKEILDYFNISNANIVGLSYGSTIAATFAKNHPEYIKNIVLMSPLIISLDRYDPQGKNFRLWLSTLDLWGPIGSYWSNYYYDMVYKWYYSKQSSTRNYDFGRWEKDYYKSVFQQVKSVNNFDLRKINFKDNLDGKKLHLITASKENKVYLPDQLSMWNIWPKEIKGSLVHIQGASHAIPDSAPAFSIAILDSIAKEENIMFKGSSFKAEIKNGKLVLDYFELNKYYFPNKLNFK